MESPRCEQRITKVSLAELLGCFEHPISEEQAWAICFQCCCKMEQLAQELFPPLHSVFIKGSGSIFIHADGTASFKVYHKSDVGSIQQSEDKLLEYLGVVIYEALDWGIDSQAERELSGPLEKLLCLMLKLDDEPIKPAVTLQDVIKACEEHLPSPSEATSHYETTCRNLFAEYMELQKLMTIIQTSKEQLRKMDMEDLVENPIQKKENRDASLWPSVICELQTGVRLRKATERPQRRVSPKECIRSPYELLLDDIQHKRYTLRKVIIKQKHRVPKVDVTAPKPHLKSVLERKLKECVLWEPSWHEQPMAEIKRPQKLWSAAQEKGSRPKEMLVTPNTASPSDSFLTPQDASTEFKIVNTKTQRLEPGAQETLSKLTDSTCLSSTRSSVASYNSTGLVADYMCPPMSAPTLGDIKPKGFLNTGQQQLPPYRRRSKSLERDLQNKETDSLLPTKWPSPTIADLIGTRYSATVVEQQGFFQRDSDDVFPRAKVEETRRTENDLQHKTVGCPHFLTTGLLTESPLEEVLQPAPPEQMSRVQALCNTDARKSVLLGLWICFSCHGQMFLKWPYNCYLCSSVVCCDCCIKMSMPFRTCIHLPLHFLKFLRLSREEDPAAQEQKCSKLLHEIEHWQYLSIPVILEPRCLAHPMCSFTGAMAAWLTADICTRCEQYLLNTASSQQQSIPLRRTSWA